MATTPTRVNRQLSQFGRRRVSPASSIRTIPRRPSTRPVRGTPLSAGAAPGASSFYRITDVPTHDAADSQPGDRSSSTPGGRGAACVFTPQRRTSCKGETMLVLTRRANEAVMIGDDIEVTVLSIIPGRVRLGVVAPRSVAIHRDELLEGGNGADRRTNGRRRKPRNAT